MSETTQTQPAAPAIVDVDYEQSPTLVEFTKALAAAQGEIENADKGADNPHFKTRYADLADVINACKAQLAKNGIARLQTPRTKTGGLVGLRTALLHVSGEYVAFTFWCIQQQSGPQALGSVLTYLRRYGLAAAVGVGQEQDDDGNAGQGRGEPPEPPRDWTKQPPKNTPAGKEASAGPKASAPPPAAQPKAAAGATTAPPADPEHAATVKRCFDVVGKDLQWEDKRIRAVVQGLFGEGATTKTLSKPQAAALLQLLMAATISQEAYESAVEKARLESPALFAPTKGAAA